MPFSQVSHVLQVLGEHDVPLHLVSRFRKDPAFAKWASETLIAKYRDDPGEKFTIEVDRTQSRLQLNTEIQRQGLNTIRDEIIEGLRPKTLFPDAGQKYLVGELKPIEQMNVWLVPLWQDTIEEEVITLLDSMGYESVQTEEALSFALQKRWGYDDCIVVLAAKCHKLKFEVFGKTCTTQGFLSFGCNGLGESMISLYDFKDFSPRVKFLVKKKQSKP